MGIFLIKELSIKGFLFSRWTKYSLLLLVLLSPTLTFCLHDEKSKPETLFAAHLLQEKFFWQRPELYQKIANERRILVSASYDDESQRWVAKGAGHVNRSLSEVWSQIEDFSILLKLNDRFKEVKYDRISNSLYVKFSLFGLDRNVTSLVQVAASDEKSKCLHWRNVEGAYVGLEGVLCLKDIGCQVTEIFMTGEYKSAKFPFTGWIISAGMEGVVHYVAVRLRSIVEGQTKR